MDKWIEPVIKVMLVVCAVLAVVGIYVAFHFIAKFW